ncbi:protein-glutamate methylesterase/protein-glutamine glutaminase [Poriferisphaera sp. WC338]|uniref:protein-glutamate methylesterase/protein-glutamine glutaminase n=1 Tax=Poriferisphaera sp. WC338 TaxID=3425129 RepID=UPI003D81319B
MSQIRVLVVDDSAFMRRAISDMLDSARDVTVIKTARNGAEAVKLAGELKPDVITLDIEMPEMDGLTALRRIKRENSQANVIMISSLTTEGSVSSLQALRLGAADVIAKDHSTFSTKISDIKDHLLTIVRALAKQSHRISAASPTDTKSTRTTRAVSSTALTHELLPTKMPSFKTNSFDVVCIGSSTGGPPILETILTAIPENFTLPVVVAQHMPKLFTQSMATRLDGICNLPVVHAEDRMSIEGGHIYIAPGGQHTHLQKTISHRYRFAVNSKPEEAVYKPSVDALFTSAANTFGARSLSVVLTGIGEDGKVGATNLSAKGAKIIAQHPDTCVVYGMPKAVTNAKLIEASLKPEQIAECLANIVGTSVTKQAG